MRVLRPDEMSELQRENEQLRKLIQQLADKAKLQEEASNADGHAYPSLAASSQSPPACNPAAASSSSSSVTFQKVPGLHSLMMSLVPPAPEEVGRSRRNSSAAAELSEATLAPVSDFYASLRASLKPSKLAAGAAGSSTLMMERPKPATVSEDEDDWDTAGARSASPNTAAGAAVVESVHAPRTEDEAVVHSKRTSVVVHKVPRRVLEDESPPAAATTAGAGAGLDDFGDDDFGVVSSPQTVSATARGEVLAEESEEEIAVFDLQDAEWWVVVPHPDREGEELKSAPPPPVDPAEDEDGFVVVKNKDSLAAISDFIAGMMAKHPEINQLSPEQLRAMLEGSIGELKDPGTMGRVWQYTRSAYTIYGWSSTAWGLYKDQTLLRIAGQ